MAGKPIVWRPLKWLIGVSLAISAVMTALTIVLNDCTSARPGVVRVLRWIVAE